MADVDDETLATIQRHIRQCKLQSSGNKATFRDVMLSLGKELDRDEVRGLMAVIKKEIAIINEKSIEELKEEEDSDETNLVENEYDELSSSFQKELEGKSYVSSLIAYGSYGKGTHIMGQSNLNFLLILKDMDQGEQERVGSEIKAVIQGIMNPLYEYLFDLVVLFDHNVSTLASFQKRMGPGFTAIHGYSAGQCKALIGTNPFLKLDLSSELKNSAKMILLDTVEQFKQSIADLRNDKDAKTEDLAYLSSEAIIDYALALIYYHLEKIEHVTKPDVKEVFPRLFRKHKILKQFIPSVEHSFAYRLGVSKIADSEITDEEIIENAERLTEEITLLLK